MLWSFGIYSPVFGILCQEKSGNPARNLQVNLNQGHALIYERKYGAVLTPNPPTLTRPPTQPTKKMLMIVIKLLVF
jgi:hypothetical protein